MLEGNERTRLHSFMAHCVKFILILFVYSTIPKIIHTFTSGLHKKSLKTIIAKIIDLKYNVSAV